MRRGSELCAFSVDDVQRKANGSSLLYLKRSKTDQEGRGMWIALSATCIEAIDDWLSVSQIRSGPILRAVNLHGHVSDQPLNPKSLTEIYTLRQFYQATETLTAAFTLMPNKPF